MRKKASQLTVALVCSLLGFMLTYQFNLISAEERKLNTNNEYGNSSEITVEIEQLKKQKSELDKKNNELLAQLKKYEDTAINQDDMTKEIKKQLEDSRLLLGIYDVLGPGVTLYLTPRNTTFSAVPSDIYLKDEELVYLVNELNFAGAEAISINDKRITSQSGIKSISNNANIVINDEKISPKNMITIRAIGDKAKLTSALEFPGALDYRLLFYYDSKINKEDSIKIPKYNKSYRADFLKPVNK